MEFIVSFDEWKESATEGECDDMTHPSNESSEDQEANRNDGLLIHDIELLRDGSCEQTGTEDDRAGLGDQVGT